MKVKDRIYMIDKMFCDHVNHVMLSETIDLLDEFQHSIPNSYLTFMQFATVRL